MENHVLIICGLDRVNMGTLASSITLSLHQLQMPYLWWGPAYGLGGSAVLSSANAPSIGELSAAALSKATYLYSSFLHLHQSCVPVRIAKLEYLCVSGSRSHGTNLNLSFQLILA